MGNPFFACKFSEFWSVGMSLLNECWQIAKAPPAKRLRSICNLALGIGSGDIMPMGPLALEGLPHWGIPVPALPSSHDAVPEPLVQPLVPTPPKLQKASKRPPPSAEDSACRTRALESWSSIFEKLGAAFEANKNLVSLGPEELTPYFAIKRTGTMAVHASAWN